MEPMFAAFLGGLTLALSTGQETAQSGHSQCSYDRVFELEITADDPELIEGWGPCSVVEYEVEFGGTLHVWTESELDLFLRVDDVFNWTTLAQEDGSGGESVHVGLTVEPGTTVAVFVSATPRASGLLTLHLSAAPETEITRAAAEQASGARNDAMRELEAGDRLAAYRIIEGCVTMLLETPGAASSDSVTSNLTSLARVAFTELAGFGVVKDALSSVERHLGRTRPPTSLELLSCRMDLASAMFETGDPVGARSLWGEVLSAADRSHSESPTFLLRVRLNLANALAVMGEVAAARALQEAVVEVYERTLPDSAEELLHARSNLALTMREMGDAVGARALQEMVLGIRLRDRPEDHPEVLRDRTNLALSMRKMGDHSEALRLRKTNFALLEQRYGPTHPSMLTARRGLAVSWLDLEEYASAREILEALLEDYEKIVATDHQHIANVQAMLALTLARTGDLEGALELAESSLTRLENNLPEGHPRVLGSRSNLALTRASLHGIAAGCTLLPGLVEGMMSRAFGALVLAPREALEWLALESTRLETVYYLTKPGSPAPLTTAFELTETLRMLSAEATRSVSMLARDPDADATAENIVRARRKLNDLVSGAGADDSSDGPDSDDLVRSSLERDRAERQAKGRFANRETELEPLDVSSLARALEPGELLVGYRRLADVREEGPGDLVRIQEDRLFAHVLDSDGTLHRYDLGPAVDLEGLVSAWRRALGAPMASPVRKGRASETGRGVSIFSVGTGDEIVAGDLLRRKILDPFLRDKGTVDRIFLCPDDLVYLVPLDALPSDATGASRFGDRVRTINEISFKRLVSAPYQPANDPALMVLGGVDYDASGSAPDGLLGFAAPIETRAGHEPHLSFSRIPESGREASAVAALFSQFHGANALLLTRAEATKSALTRAVEGRSHVHLATHGWFADDMWKATAQPAHDSDFRLSLKESLTGLAPMTLCGLALAGANRGRDSLGRVPGILTAEELSSLDLSDCELAVLSACETNVGIRRAGQGIQSLQAALYAAGARSSITSLWKVDDAATRRLMEIFYTNLWEEEMPKAEALWEAKKVLREEGAPIRDWAGWVLTGDPN